MPINSISRFDHSHDIIISSSFFTYMFFMRRNDIFMAIFSRISLLLPLSLSLYRYITTCYVLCSPTFGVTFIALLWFIFFFLRKFLPRNSSFYFFKKIITNFFQIYSYKNTPFLSSTKYVTRYVYIHMKLCWRVVVVKYLQHTIK